uniref:Uncharacterized protein n=1 Tax=Myotis myotis TaxID=51298 RepID=A0A7J7WID6_MYOMY|nr:hypothetical protein mMyoMyo1_012162 [Myotis myotis]
MPALCVGPGLDFRFPPSCFSQGHKAPSPSKPCRSPSNDSVSLRCNLGNSLTNRDLLGPEKPRPESQEHGLGSGFELVAREQDSFSLRGHLSKLPLPSRSLCLGRVGPWEAPPSGPGAGPERTGKTVPKRFTS